MLKFPIIVPAPEPEPIPEWGVEIDSHLVVRETPAWKVREQWALVQHAHLQSELQVLHAEDHSHDVVVPHSAIRPQSWWMEKLDDLEVFVCRHFHKLPKYIRGEDYSTCPTCQRRYGAPWADPKKLDADVYISSEKFINNTTFTKQAI